jgi:succinate dehydrogenase / fumarate reductase cytochrome b subunit
MTQGKYKNKRPVFLHLLKIRLPVGGIVSITHRITGVLLTLSLPIALYFLALSLKDEAGFEMATKTLQQPTVKILLLLGFWFFTQHFFSGLRHLLMDIDTAMSKTAARASAWLVFVLSLTTTVGLGVCWL